jgi:hypothetical protein
MHLQDCKTDKTPAGQQIKQEKYLAIGLQKRFLQHRATASDEANMEESFGVLLQTQRMVPTHRSQSARIE